MNLTTSLSSKSGLSYYTLSLKGKTYAFYFLSQGLTPLEEV